MNRDIVVEIEKDLRETKRQLEKMTSAFERRDDFIIWLIEIKLDNEYNMSELWDEFEKYEQSDEGE